jgi:sec-independent protein translocase protein TatA
MGLDNPLHIAFLLVVLLLVFGARRLPEIGRSLGGGMREFKDSLSGMTHESQPVLPHNAQAQASAQPVAAAQAPVAQPAPAPVVQAPAATQAPVAAQAPVEPAQQG